MVGKTIIWFLSALYQLWSVSVIKPWALSKDTPLWPSLGFQKMHLGSPAHPQKSGCDKPYGRSLSCSWVRPWWTAGPHCSWSRPGRSPQGSGARLTARLPSTHAELWKGVPWSEKQKRNVRNTFRDSQSHVNELSEGIAGGKFLTFLRTQSAD